MLYQSRNKRHSQPFTRVLNFTSTVDCQADVGVLSPQGGYCQGQDVVALSDNYSVQGEDDKLGQTLKTHLKQ
jgi:hypothetical protein